MMCVIFSIPVRLVRHASIGVLLGVGIPRCWQDHHTHSRRARAGN